MSPHFLLVEIINSLHQGSTLAPGMLPKISCRPNYEIFLPQHIHRNYPELYEYLKYKIFNGQFI